MDYLSIAFQDFNHVGRAHVGGGSKIFPKDYGLIWECQDTVMEHHPVVPAKLVNLADVHGIAGHYFFRHISLCCEYITHCERVDESGKLETMVP